VRTTARPPLVRIHAPLVAASIIGAAAAVAGIGLTATAAWLISRAAEHPNVAALSVAVVGVRFFGISRGLLRYLERLIGHDAALRALAEQRVNVYRKLETLAPAGLPAFRSGDLLVRLVDDVDSLQDMLLRSVLPYAVAFMAGAVTVGVLGWLLPAAGLLFAVAFLLAGIAVPGLSVWLVRRSEARQAQTRGELSTVIVDLLHGAPDLISYGAVTAQLRLTEAIDARLTRQARAAARTTGIGSGLTTLLGGLAFWGALVAGIAAIATGGLAGRWLAAVVLIPLAAFELMTGLPPAAATFERVRPRLTRLADVLDTPAPAVEPADPAPVPPAPHAVRLREVCARYSENAPLALSGIDLDLVPRRTVAVVGPSGSGKSTLAAVLLRFLDAESGQLTLNGTPFAQLSGDAVRRVIGLCAQDAHVFDSTIADNLRLAVPDAPEETLWQALAAAGLSDWVETLPDVLETAVGEHGSRLSGGQRQRLVLARALLADFPVMIFDEPTEHLDSVTADARMAELLELCAAKATLVITHRLTGLTAVDEIVVLDSGRIVERGRHADLVERQGRYAQLWWQERRAEDAVVGP
jgi:thiol reductant ABC exporter CydC subunit